MDKSKKIFLIDAHAYLHRAYHALPPLTTSSGEAVGAVYGFSRMLQKMLQEQKPEYLAVCFDSPGPTFRHREYAEYKATRKETEDALKAQFPIVRELMDAWGLPSFSLGGYEADDLMATLTAQARAKGWQVVLVTSDKDVLQLVEEGVSVLDAAKGITYDPKKVEQRYGVGPGRLLDYFALVGDSSDNVPGVKGIGPKTAAELVRGSRTTEELLEFLRTNRNGPSQKQFEFSRSLLELKMDVPLPKAPEECRLGSPDKEKLVSLLKRLEFTGLLKQLLPESIQLDLGSAEKRLDPEKFFSLARKSQSLSLFLKGSELALGVQTGESCVLDLKGLEKKEKESLRSLLEDPKLEKIGHDLKAIDRALKEGPGLELQGLLFDTALAAYTLNPSRSRYALEDLLLDYSAKSLWELRPLLKKELEEKGLKALYGDLELPLMKILSRMESDGVKVDRDYLKALSREMEESLAELEKALKSLAGTEINLNSPKQIAGLLFEKFKLPPVKKTKTGYSTDEEVLRALSSSSPFCSKLLEYREVSKLKSTYVDNLLERALPDSDRIRTHLNQMGTATGRLASDSPNLQNIPIRGALGQKVRRAFVPEKGKVFLSADYSQIDLRVLAHLSGDEALGEAFRKGRDIHTQTACALFKAAPKEVTSEMRHRAKAVNFGLIYGQSAFGLSQMLGIEAAEAQKMIDAYFENHPGVRKWIEETIARVRRQGQVRTLLGRVRYVPEINSKNRVQRSFAERVAVNTPVQGSSSDIIKKAMIGISQEMDPEGGMVMVLQVHDELLFEVPEKRLAHFAKEAKEKMETAVELSVPLIVTLKAGSNWQDLEAYAAV